MSDQPQNRLLDDYLPAPDPDAIGPRTWQSDARGLWEDAMQNIDQYVTHPISRAGWMPMHLLSRYMDPTGVNPFWRSGKPDDGTGMNVIGAALPSITNQLIQSGYEPGKRESDNAYVDYRLRLF